MKKMKVVTIVGTRPEIIRLSRVLAALDKHCEHSLVHTGQNYDYELNQIFFDELGIRKPDQFLDAAKGSPSETIGNIIMRVDALLDELKPDALLVLGDTNSCLSVIPAKRRKIPIFHMEAGNRCFDQRVPEETNRRIVDHVADINMTYSDIARSYLLAEGLPPDRIIKTGSPMFEVLNHYRSVIDQSAILDDLDLAVSGYFLVSAHREENIETPRLFENLVSVLNSVAEQFDKPVIVSTHPRTRNRIAAENIVFHPRVQLLKPLGFLDYVKLQTCADVVLSDSGTISEESSILNFRALNIRESHERPEAMEEASVMMTGLDPERVMQCIEMVRAQQPDGTTNFQMVKDYSMPNVSEKVVRIIQSYTDYIRRVVWNDYS